MTTNLTRRTALMGTVTLPAALAPAAALATAQFAQFGAAMSESDPAVLAYWEWVEALLANNADPHDDDTPEGAPLFERYIAANEVMFDVVPTTPEGLACKARYIADLCGDLELDGDPTKPEDYLCHKWPNGEELRFIDSLLAYAERLAGGATGTAAQAENATDAAWAELEAAQAAFDGAHEKWEAFDDWIGDQIGPKPVLFRDTDPREFYARADAWREAREKLPENPHQHPADGEPRERLWAARDALACAPVATMTDLERKLSVAHHVDDEQIEGEFSRTILAGVRAMTGRSA